MGETVRNGIRQVQRTLSRPARKGLRCQYGEEHDVDALPRRAVELSDDIKQTAPKPERPM